MKKMTITFLIIFLFLLVGCDDFNYSKLEQTNEGFIYKGYEYTLTDEYPPFDLEGELISIGKTRNMYGRWIEVFSSKLDTDTNYAYTIDGGLNYIKEGYEFPNVNVAKFDTLYALKYNEEKEREKIVSGDNKIQTILDLTYKNELDLQDRIDKNTKKYNCELTFLEYNYIFYKYITVYQVDNELYLNISNSDHSINQFFKILDEYQTTFNFLMSS